METPLINIKDVQDYADLSVTIKERKYNQYILEAQNRFLSEIIPDCIDGLVDRNCSGTLTAADDLLLEYIKPYLVAYSYALYVGSSMKLSLNSGAATISGENATVIGQQSRVNETKKYVLSALGYGKKIKKFLSENPTDYPCYTGDLQFKLLLSIFRNMIPKEILIPSEVNEINITAKSGEPLNNGGDTFGFVYSDECGNDENIDISSYEFAYTISLSNCIKKSGSTIIGDLQKGTGDDSNKLWFNINRFRFKA